MSGAAKPIPEVRGTALLGAIRFSREHSSHDPLWAIVADSSPRLQVLFSEQIQALRWYPYRDFAELLTRIEARHGPEACRLLGAFAGKEDLSTSYSLFVRLYSPQRLIKVCRRVWSYYYRNAGHMVAISTDPEHTVVQIRDFPDMSPAHCRLMEGWMIEALRSLDLEVDPGAGETGCMSRGSNCHEFVCKWRPKAA